MDAVWDGRSDEAGIWVWVSVHGSGLILGANVGRPIVTNGEFAA